MATFNFVFDGQVDMMSLNPLEMTNFEMMGAIFGVLGVVVTIVQSRRTEKRLLPHKFVPVQTEEGALD